MGATSKAGSDTRRGAEMMAERLVQEHGIERADTFVAAEGDENSAGEEQAGSDTEAGSPSPEDRDDAMIAASSTGPDFGAFSRSARPVARGCW